MTTRQFLTGLILLAAAGGATLAAEPIQPVSSHSSHHQHAAVDKVAVAPPPSPYVSIDSLVALPKFVPGYGYFYTTAASLPSGPYLAYDRQGKLVSVTYMLSLKELNERKGFLQMGTSVAGMRVDHTDVNYNNGHPGLAAPHIHVTQWLISHEEEQQLK